MERYPVVLCHGYGRPNIFWDKFIKAEDKRVFDRFHYFRNVRKALEKEGYVVYHSTVPWVADVYTRAIKLRKNIRRILDDSNAAKVHLVAHSMGGLDARRMLFMYHDTDEMIHDRIATVSTIGTPHKGSYVADMSAKYFGWAMKGVSKITPLNLRGVTSLTSKECESFNNRKEVIEFEENCGIRFFSYGGMSSLTGVCGIYKLTYLYVRRKERKKGDINGGGNDGVVSARQAEWSENFYHKNIADLDHACQICIYSPERIGKGELPGHFNRRTRGIYLEIVRRAEGSINDEQRTQHSDNVDDQDTEDERYQATIDRI